MPDFSPTLSRAARSLLDWSQTDFAAQSQVGVSTIRNFERGAHKPIRANMAAMKSALETGGVVFIGGKRIGVTIDAAKITLDEKDISPEEGGPIEAKPASKPTLPSYSVDLRHLDGARWSAVRPVIRKAIKNHPAWAAVRARHGLKIDRISSLADHRDVIAKLGGGIVMPAVHNAGKPIAPGRVYAKKAKRS